MVRRKSSAKVARAGVTRTQMYVEEELGWIFREQPIEDFGIDAHVEVVDGEQVSGRLVALQIKSGSSWFDEATAGGWWYRPDEDHVAYWTSHSLPVVVVLYSPVTKRCHWQLVDNKTLERSKTGGWRLLVLETNVLDATAAEQWRTAADGDPYELRVRELRLAKPWIDMLARGTRVVVDFAEWINKSSGRGSISIGIDREDGNDPEELVIWHLVIGPSNYAETVPELFAWADAYVHDQTYDDAEYDQYEAECSIWDEGDQLFTTSFGEWRTGLVARGIRPYKNVAGEVDYYRVELTLNELGKAFLVVDEFATTGIQQLTE